MSTIKKQIYQVIEALPEERLPELLRFLEEMTKTCYRTPQELKISRR